MPSADVSFDSDFLLNCRELGIEATPEEIQQRWNGATAVASAVTRATLDALIRIAFGIRDVKGRSSADWFREHWGKAGQPLLLTNYDRESQLMAASALLALYANSGKMSLWAALATVTSSLRRQRDLRLPCDIIARAERVLGQRSDSIRTRRPTSCKGIEQKVSDAFALAAHAFEQGAQDLPTAFNHSLEAAKTASQTLATAMFQSLDALDDSLAARDEELDMLWWLVGGRIRLGSIPFDKVDHGAQPLLMARDLAVLTKLLPGPASIAAVLARAINSPDDTCCVADCVNACAYEWMETSLSADPSPVSQPIHFALSRRLETRDNTTWIPGWRGQTQLTPEVPLSRVALAETFYLEALQLRS